MVNKGDFIISLRSFQGGIELSNIDGIASPAYTIMKFKNENNDVYFWKEKFKTYNFIQSLKTVTFGIRDGKSISFSEFKTLKLKFPNNLTEQIKIGKLFNLLNNCIVLKQRELDLYKKLKKGLLQKLFPSDGENVPIVRFADFNGDWEQRKAVDLLEPIAKKGFEYLPVLSVTQENGVVERSDLNIDIKYDKSTLSNYKLVEAGNFVISLRSFQGGIEFSNINGIVSPAYTIIKFKSDDNDHYFWKEKFKTYNFIQSLKTVTFGSRDGKSISFSEFKTLNLKFPHDSKEQHKIGIILSEINKIIDLKRLKIKKLESIKKYYLQKLFV